MNNLYTIICLLLVMMTSCDDKLNIKPDSNLITPKTLNDFENLLDNAEIINTYPGLAQLSADEYHIPKLANFNALTRPMLRSTYVWDKDIFQGMTKVPDWTIPYQQIFYANSVLDEIKKIDISSDIEMQRVKGWALFVRAYAFYSLVSIYSKAYDQQSANIDLGIPIKLSAAITELVPRSNIADSYNQIINDAIEASTLLQPQPITGKRNRPSKAAAFSLLARVYLSMRKYTEAEKNVDKALELYKTLTDYKALPIKTGSSFSYDSEEVIYFSNMRITSYSSLYAGGALFTIHPSIINSFDNSDLRKTVWFRQNINNGNWYIKGINSLAPYPFTGLATDELYLIKAECLARRDQIQDAMDYINHLLKTRWNPNATTPAKPYQDIVTTTPTEALNIVLQERRKSLLWRSIRWTDLKRLNLEGRNIILTRDIEGTKYTLEPNSPKYVLPIPDDEVTLSNVAQNLR